MGLREMGAGWRAAVWRKQVWEGQGFRIYSRRHGKPLEESKQSSDGISFICLIEHPGCCVQRERIVRILALYDLLDI